MSGSRIEIPVDGRRVRGYLAAPAEPGPGVVVLQEWWGLVPHIEDVCDRFAAEGFHALAPDLYEGRTAGSPDEAGKLMMALDIERTAATLGGAVSHLLALPGTSSAKAGVVGFCMGGQLALYAACRFPEAIGACVDFYGIHPAVEPDLARLEAPLLGFFAANDASVTPERAGELARELRRLGKTAEIEVIPGVGHAFFNDTRPEVHDPAAARRCWQRTVAHFREHLPPRQA